MARRNPMNERYQKTTSPAGKTRRSAASARPKRPSGEGTAKPVKKAKAAASRPSFADLQPQTEEYKKLRRAWWVLLIVSLVLTSASFFANNIDPKIGTYMIIAGYVFLGAALFIDLTKLRKMRKEWAAAGGKPEKAAGGKKAENEAAGSKQAEDDFAEKPDKS